MKQTTLFILICCVGYLPLSAQQKFGHVRSLEVLAELNAVKLADIALKASSDSLVTIRTSKVTALETKFKEYSRLAQGGTLTKVQIEEKKAELATERDAITRFEQEAQLFLSARRQYLYSPILKKVDEVISSLAKEKGITMVFDASQPDLLFANNTEDLTQLVKDRMKM